jgi:hypothetical protein
MDSDDDEHEHYYERRYTREVEMTRLGILPKTGAELEEERRKEGEKQKERREAVEKRNEEIFKR